MQLLQVFFELKKRNSFYYFLAKSVFICIFLKANSYPLEMFTKGIKMITYEYERFLPKIKSLNYMAAVISLQKAKKQQAQDALFISKNGNILEGTTVNFFGILDGKLVNNSKRKKLL
jgi:branched-subunit amino acid aminotransferase/4-amino-4-deoxychorismate lyase